MCRFYYRNGYCANPQIESNECIGETKCYIMIYNTKVKKVNNGCEYDLGYGVYCKKYQRFYCAGKENCNSLENYMKSFLCGEKIRRDYE